MKVFQMTLDEKLVKTVDQTVKKLRTTRSAFTRQALKHELESIKIRELESKQLSGYKIKPVKADEFDIWENEQVWTD